MVDSANFLLMRDALLSSPIKGPLLAMAVDGDVHHQPFTFKGGYGEEDAGRTKSPKGWALWGQRVRMKSSREVDEEEEVVTRRKKIKRLKVEQVRALEASFEEEKKLEPEKKQDLALQLGLEPRQVAVWFQNRRARSKSKQLELDFALLSSHYHSLLVETHRLKYEVSRLTKELDDVSRGSNRATPKLSRGIQKEEDMFKMAPFKNEVLGALIQDKMNMLDYTKECSSTCSTYSMIVDAESSTSMSHKDTSAYECISLEKLECSCLPHGWNEDRLSITHELAPLSYATLQPPNLVLDVPPWRNAMMHHTIDWLWGSTT